MKFSPSTLGFYSQEVHSVGMPGDVTDEKDWPVSYADLLAGQSAGLKIASDENGMPALVEHPPITADEQAKIVRAERDRRMDDFSWRYERYSREARMGVAPTDKIELLDDYMKAISDLPEQPGFPFNFAWPVEP